MRRFFIPADQIQGDQAWIKGDDCHHLRVVLRKMPGEIFEATDGQGCRLRVRITAWNSDAAELEILDRLPSLQGSAPLTVYQAIPRGNMMDLIVEKLTELGVSRVIPLMTERTIPRYEADKAEKKQQRWQKIAQETVKKMGRAGQTEVVLPGYPEKISDYLQPGSLRILAWELEDKCSLRKLLQNQPAPAYIEIAVGPEGGFSRKEAAAWIEKGFIPVSLGPRILTVETAVISLTAIIGHYWDL